MGRRRNKGDAGNGIPRLSNDFIDLEAGQLSTLAGLCTLGHLNLYFSGIHQILRCDSETTGCHLLHGAAERNPVHLLVETSVELASLASVAAGAQFVQRQGYSLVSLLADGSEGHCGASQTGDNLFYGLNLGNVYGVLLELEIIPYEKRFVAVVHKIGELLELLVAAQSCGQLEGRNRLGCPGMQYAVFAERILTCHRQHIVCLTGKTLGVHTGRILCDSIQPYASYA